MSPCPWPIVFCGDANTGDTECSSINGLSPEMAEAIQDAAVEFLWEFSGRQYGLCEIPVRPCLDPCGNSESTYRGWSGSPAGFVYGNGGLLNPVIFGGNWINLVCGNCSGDRCSCTALSTIKLPGPVSSVTEVRLNGVILTEGVQWRYDNLGLARIDGLSWPRCQNQDADPATDPDTLVVTYLRGKAVPALGRVAAGILSCELAKFACGDKSCQLPKNVTNITREGVSISVQSDLKELWERGSTGLRVVDMFLASASFSARKNHRRVSSPDIGPLRRVL